ncbi:MAG: DUF4870 domain-containing protein [Actinobacteria bacterium]|nr:DUF4870 domain-containing protein [Actinomycetota bacterium]MBU4483079.1 DUF4870 domain-containing protein [Actinomycetota bacterium]
MVEVKKVEVDSDFSKKSSTGMEPKIAVLLAYLFSWLGGLIILLIEKENRFVKWNALQALILGIVEVACIFVISFILGLIPYIGWFFFSWLGWVLAGVAWIFAIIAIVMGFQGKTFRIPGVSSLADKYFKM